MAALLGEQVDFQFRPGSRRDRTSAQAARARHDRPHCGGIPEALLAELRFTDFDVRDWRALRPGGQARHQTGSPPRWRVLEEPEVRNVCAARLNFADRPEAFDPPTGRDRPLGEGRAHGQDSAD
jgi:hypothetical protein